MSFESTLHTATKAHSNIVLCNIFTHRLLLIYVLLFLTISLLQRNQTQSAVQSSLFRNCFCNKENIHIYRYVYYLLLFLPITKKLDVNVAHLSVLSQVDHFALI